MDWNNTRVIRDERNKYQHWIREKKHEPRRGSLHSVPHLGHDPGEGVRQKGFIITIFDCF